MAFSIGILSAAGSSRVYATLDPLRHSPNVTTIDGNLTGTNLSTSSGVGIATIGKNSDKWYWETTVNSSNSNDYGKVGITNVLMVPGSGTPTGLGSGGTGGIGTVGYYGNSPAAQARYNLSSIGINFVAGTGGVIVNGDILSTALDCAANQVTFYRNGNIACVVNLAPGGSVWYPAFASTSGIFTSVTFNFGQNTWSNATPELIALRASLLSSGYTIGLY